MKLTFKVHLDDYHDKREIQVTSELGACKILADYVTLGYDLGEVKIDGKPFDFRVTMAEYARLLAAYPKGTWAGD